MLFLIMPRPSSLCLSHELTVSHQCKGYQYPGFAIRSALTSCLSRVYSFNYISAYASACAFFPCSQFRHHDQEAFASVLHCRTIRLLLLHWHLDAIAKSFFRIRLLYIRFRTIPSRKIRISRSDVNSYCS